MAKISNENWREIELSGSSPIISSLFMGNEVSSGRYTLASFLPKNLFEQFQRTSNIWFLLVSVFQLIPIQLNPTNSWTTIAPLGILIFFTLLKDAYNDYFRHKDDIKVNSSDYDYWNGSEIQSIKCKDILVGHILLLKSQQQAPADILLIATESKDGACYVRASGVVGETNLKKKIAVSDVQKLFQTMEREFIIKKISGLIRIEQPNSDFCSFHGILSLKGHPKSIDLSLDNLIFRGSTVLGSKWAIGIVLYAGEETKTQLNIRSPPKKTSRIEKKVNEYVIYILMFLLIMVSWSVLAHFVLSTTDDTDTPFESYISFTLLYNNITPISLFVTMDIIRIIQLYFIQRDSNKEIIFKTGDINEDLGQVEYILADKTGTLTENKLCLQTCIIENTKYCREDPYSCDLSINLNDEEKGLYVSTQDNHDSTNYVSEKNNSDFLQTGSSFNFQKLYENLTLSGEGTKLYEFVKCMALCNNTVPGQDANSEFVGTSMDENALVEAADELGINLISRNNDSCVLKMHGTKECFQILASSPFSSENRKSRILVKKQDHDIATLYVKGSVSEMLPLFNISPQLKYDIEEQSLALQLLGQRTILLGFRILKKDDYNEFLAKLDSCKNFPINREGRIESVYQELESNLVFLGTAGIEDIVTQETQNAIDNLKRAGIKIWVLSGDSEAATVTTAYKAHIINRETTLFKIHDLINQFLCTKALQNGVLTHIYKDNSVAVSRKASAARWGSVARSRKQQSVYRKPANEIRNFSLLEANDAPRHTIWENHENEDADNVVAMNGVEKMLAVHPIFQDISKQEKKISDAFLNRPFIPFSVDFSISIDSASLSTAMNDEESRKLLVCLLLASQSACFYGLTPRDKALVVKLLKENVKFKPLTLAVGDGNNDIPMIQEADIGVGVLSKEESQAPNYSEIVIKNFSQLEDLLLFHGYWNYNKMSRGVLLFFYKNFVLTMITFVYIWYTDYSDTSIFNDTLLVGYNIFFTTLPIIVMSVFDDPLPNFQIREYPQIYSEGIKCVHFNAWRFIECIAFAICQGLFISLFGMYAFGGIQNNAGFVEDYSLIGTSLYIATVFAVLIQIWIQTYAIGFIYVATHFVSIVLLICAIIIVTAIDFSDNDLYGVGEQIGNSSVSLMLIFLLPLVCVTTSLMYFAYKTIFHPNLLVKIKRMSFGRPLFYKFLRLEEYSTCLVKAYKPTSNTKSNVEKEAFEMNKFTLRFLTPYIEKLYSEGYIHENLTYYKIIVSLLWVLLIIWTFLESFLLSVTLSYILMRIILCIAFTIILIIVFTDYFKNNYLEFTLIIIFIGILVKFGTEMAYAKAGPLATGCVPSLTYILFNVDWYLITFLNAQNLILHVISISYTYAEQNMSATEAALIILSFITINASITFTSAIVGYVLDRTKRLEYKYTRIKEMGIEKTQEILSFLLPAFVKKRVKEGARYIAEDQGTVTILFCDICDFDTICSEYTPIELTTFLDELFQKFDQFCTAIGVTKIETVGKTYMACAGLKDSELEMEDYIKKVSHARRTIELAFAMISHVQTVGLKNGSLLKVKIGINSGEVTAGVVGYHKPQFSLVGDTVNTASRMCSTLEEYNKIQISKETYDLIGDYKGLAFINNRVEAKGKGILDTFIVSEGLQQNSDEIETIQLSPDTKTPGNNSLFRKISLQFHEHDSNNSSPQSPKRKGRSTQRLTQLNIEPEFLHQNEAEILEKINIFDFQCKESAFQRKFRRDKLLNNKAMMHYSLLIALINSSILLFFCILEYFLLSDYSQKENILCRSVIVATLLVLFLGYKKIYIRRIYPIVLMAILFTMVLNTLFYITNDTKRPVDLIALEIMYIILILNFTGALNIALIIWSSLGIFIPWVTIAFFNSDPSLNIANALLVLGFSIINTSAAYGREKNLRTYFNMQKLAEKEIEKTDKLLTQMMPPHVVENMKQGKAITDRLFRVTLLFADIVGFTAWSSNKTPKDVVGMLSELFTRFDKMCVNHNVYKVHTIGDCYVVMGYNGNESRDPAQECLNMINMAKAMIEIIEEVNRENNSQLKMRIGLHTGEVIAGIIGTTIVRYDIYGPDVLIANKMESGGLAGYINVSDITREILEERYPSMFSYEFNKEIEAKSIKRKHKSYFIEFK
ncbi:unnamed protein product [Blepharisma stoltei]|uniref:P-type phospholipid transporter n=1 Tax=Blepharisma stoltei TaxID=1481888 RepID=A0AAU9KE45_9CILI|nr:unnamed protein product [Blepharisma stoltei]